MQHSRLTPFALFCFLTAALGGFLFGFNTSVIAGALLFLQEDFQLTTFHEETVVSVLLIGALIGAFLGDLLPMRGVARKLFS